MGKPKKKQGIRRPGIAQQFESEDERERVKQRILQVFRSRLHSPHKAGALLVGTIPPGADNTNNSRKDVYGVKMNHDDSSQDSGKMKRRRTRGELNRKRNRRRVTAAKEVAECTSTQKPSHDRSEFCKQLKLAQDMASGAKSERTMKDRTLNAITNNRLTRNLGLFNQGKKSMAVSRESGLQVPESVRHQTEQDFKKIVCRSPEKPEFCSITISNAVETKSQTSCHRNLSTPIKIQSSSDTVQAVLVDEEMRSPNSLPSSPCMAEIAADLTAGLHPRSVFPQSNILHETKDELARLLKQNAPADGGGSLMTPLGQTPGMRTTLLRSGLSSETVKRNLLDSLPPTASSNAEEQQVQSGENFTFLSASQPTPDNHGNFPSPDLHRAMSAPSNHGDSDIPTMSACSLFRQSSTTSSHSTQEMDETHREINALAHFQQPNRVQGAVYHNNTVYYMHRDHALNMVGDSSLGQVSRQYFPDAMESDIEMQSGIHNYNSLPTAGSEGGVVVCGNNTAYMPSHHADLHGLKHLQQVDMLRQHPTISRPHQVDDLDLLDYLDLGGSSSSHLAPQPPLAPYQHPPTVQPSRDSPRPSSTNPSWYAALVIPPPQLQDTSPPHKLYPHRLY